MRKPPSGVAAIVSSQFPFAGLVAVPSAAGALSAALVSAFPGVPSPQAARAKAATKRDARTAPDDVNMLWLTFP
jgi:hypothetical protein